MESPAIRPALAAAERLRDILASPFRVMQDVAERVADKLVPDPLSDDKTKLSPAVALYAAQPELSAAPSPSPAPAPAPLSVSKNSNKSAGKKRASITKPAAKPAKKTSPIKKVKLEPTRDMPFRQKRSSIKAGFYNESNLQALAWRGSGSEADPIRFND